MILPGRVLAPRSLDYLPKRVELVGMAVNMGRIQPKRTDAHTTRLRLSLHSKRTQHRLSRIRTVRGGSVARSRCSGVAIVVRPVDRGL